MSNNNNVKALKSGVWYIAANFITKGMVFLSTPIFTRLLSHEEYGLFSNYTSWLSSFTVVMTLNLGATFICAKFDFKDTFDSYVSSSTCLCLLSALVWTVLINAFSVHIVALTGIEIKHLNIMMFYMMFHAVIELYLTKERYRYEYKKSVILSLLISIGSTGMSILLVCCMSNKLDGRIWGNSLLSIIIGVVLTVDIIAKGKSVKIEHWKYALPICLPYIPHLLSLTVLNSVDRIMITKICGAEDNALYTLAYSCGAIVTLLIISMNTAFSPWLGEKLKANSLQEIRNFSAIYIKMFAFLACGLMLISPELLLLMGGKGYSGSLYVMPPVAYGFVCQFVYTMYVNVEQFMKKTLGMAVASTSAALLNFGLNYFFIHRFGYVAAAYTTLVSFLWLLIIHVLLVHRIGMDKVYNLKAIVTMLLIVACFTIIVNFLFRSDVIRYCVVAVYIAVFAMLGKRHYKKIVHFIKS